MELNLGQYWLEVTLSYGITLILLAALITASWRASRRAEARLRELEETSDDI